ncbi:transmembrane protein 104 isoform 4-T6 [Dama dama]
MAGEITETGELYSPYVGLVYMFNLIVGTGALTMPKAFATAGWLVSLVLLVFLGFMSFMTTTFVVEAMGAANAQLRWKRMEARQDEEDDDSSSSASDSDVLAQDSYERAEKRPILSVQRRGSSLFEITDRVEMGQMASMFFNKVGVNLFYFCIIVYLYGDLAIYAAAVPFSLMQVTCSALGNDSCGVEADAKYNDTDPCWGPLRRMDAYRIYLAVFTLLLGPFTFFDVQKTKYLQILTSLMRWIAQPGQSCFLPPTCPGEQSHPSSASSPGLSSPSIGPRLHHHDRAGPGAHRAWARGGAPTAGRPLGHPEPAGRVRLLLHVPALPAIAPHPRLLQAPPHAPGPAGLRAHPGVLRAPLLHCHLLLPRRQPAGHVHPQLRALRRGGPGRRALLPGPLPRLHHQHQLPHHRRDPPQQLEDALPPRGGHVPLGCGPRGVPHHHPAAPRASGLLHPRPGVPGGHHGGLRGHGHPVRHPGLPGVPLPQGHPAGLRLRDRQQAQVPLPPHLLGGLRTALGFLLLLLCHRQHRPQRDQALTAGRVW